MELVVDAKRMGAAETGIFVRAKRPDGRWMTADIAQLTDESLYCWLRSRGGSNIWAENTVAVLLGHKLRGL